MTIEQGKNANRTNGTDVTVTRPAEILLKQGKDLDWTKKAMLYEIEAGIPYRGDDQ